ncbi:MAG: peptidoglycan DD-metalloendopeptidase family protein [Bacteroidia bacterium]
MHKRTDSIKHYKTVSKAELANLIDSVFDLKNVTSKDLDMMSYYASLLNSTKSDSVRILKFRSVNIMTRSKLAHLVDSVLELKNVNQKDVDLLNYYTSLLNSNNTDEVKISEFNLSELSFYSDEDEKLLFPLTPTDSLPKTFNLVLENDLLSYYVSPFKGVVTSNYGWRDKRMHNGIDIDLNKGDKVCAAFDGKVRFAKKQGGFGNVVILMHPNGLETVYAHLSKLKVKAGDIVLSGQTVGLGGNTGHSTGSHLHLEVRYKGHAVNPATIISFNDHKLYHHTITFKAAKQKLSAFPANSNLHKVNRGESWNYIATQYGITTKQLMVLNGVSKRYYLKVGQQLRVN